MRATRLLRVVTTSIVSLLMEVIREQDLGKMDDEEALAFVLLTVELLA